MEIARRGAPNRYTVNINPYPQANLAHLMRMTDDTGLLQHAEFDVPRYEDGYCLDDNARALLLMVMLQGQGYPGSRELTGRYLAFVRAAFNHNTGWFRNFMSYGRAWTEEAGSEDSHGRALWALGTVVGRSQYSRSRQLATNLFDKAISAVKEFFDLRGVAYALLGLDEYLISQPNGELMDTQAVLATKLFQQYEKTATPEWPWFEETATYCNARLSQALICSGEAIKDSKMLQAGLKSLEWLCGIQKAGPEYGYVFSPIGSKGWYERGDVMPTYDQQPVEACAMVSACLTAYCATGEKMWLGEARHTFEWFLGKNLLAQPLYDRETGGCCDGLMVDSLNHNMGAESTLSFQMAAAEMNAAPA